MKKLLKQYGMNSDMQYFEMIVESVINGQITQSKEQFKAMTREQRKQFVGAIFGNWSTPLSESHKQMFLNLI